MGQPISGAAENLLQGYIHAARLPDLQWPDFSRDQKEVQEFYEACPSELPWLRGGKPTRQALDVIRSLKAADLKGLRPGDYDAAKWDARLALLGSPGAAEADLVRFDIALTVSTMRFLSDLHIGRVNPHEFHFALDIGPEQMNLPQFIAQKLVSAADVDAAIQSVEPPFPVYLRIEHALKQLKDLAPRDQGVTLPLPPKPVKPGGTYPAVAALAERLALIGDLPEGQWQSGGDQKYQGALVAAVKRFQLRHGFDTNGILDAQTVKEMNVPLSQRITQIELAMERIRWLPHHFDRPPVVVNIPEFRLYALNDQYVSAFSMKVVVGKSYQHKTPVFANEIKSIIFRPYWNVPESILRAELLPHLEKDPDYISKNQYQVVDSKEHVVSEGVVTEDMKAELRSGALRVRQEPGPKDALGLIKFEFPNAYDVYMHDTPAQELFSRSRRDFSHGCIRVEAPVKLAAWLLRDMPQWDEEHIRNAMNGEETFAVKLDKPTPVLIFYSTVVVLDDGMVRFFDDIYGYDKTLTKALDAGPPYGSVAESKR